MVTSLFAILVGSLNIQRKMTETTFVFTGYI